ncbi:unnamed protein product [Acanthoscelides obtectus]|uniref:Transposase n=1 Tax=Acanthoscelides obtectus TaxID=200917 RepID=A0A9P0LHV3_ACAOB|nr:unnamed protein product [Acanthoscelides obtectus]CAK1673381.1 Histone-lysine N-methyltransferase SETMAR [Acanthoscelides obtectus]
MELNREHFRAIIYYNFQRQLSQQECPADVTSVDISRWYEEFSVGRVSLSDDPRVGAPKTKLVSRWIPHLLTEEQKAARVNWCQKKLDRQPAVWVFQGEEKPTKVIRSRSVSKKMVATFVSKQRTVTADWYTTICLPKVITEFRKINPERRINLHQDNASSHTAPKTRQYLTEENVELLDHPPYSPDLSHNDFFTYPKIKNRRPGQSFQSPEEAVDAFKNAVLDLPANERNKLVRAHADVYYLRGKYFEKQ